MFESLALLSFGEHGWGWALVSGAVVTISLALACLPIGVPLGLVVAASARSKSRVARSVATVFATVFRGLPELLTLLLVYYGCQIGFQKLALHMGWETEIVINAFMAAVFSFSLVFAAFSSEIWIGAFRSIPKGQYEASKTLGLSRTRTFVKVVFPQAFRVALPGLSNNWLALLKDTSLVSTISLIDIMRQTSLAVASTKEPIIFYMAACFLYLGFAAISELVFRKAEQRLNVSRSVRT